MSMIPKADYSKLSPADARAMLDSLKRDPNWTRDLLRGSVERQAEMSQLTTLMAAEPDAFEAELKAAFEKAPTQAAAQALLADPGFREKFIAGDAEARDKFNNCFVEHPK